VIGGKAEWGHFKFGHTDPAQSNSGLLALVLMAYDFAGKQRGLTQSDVTSPAFLEWLTAFERSVTRIGGSLKSSTGTLMEEMVKRGPSQYDGLIVYENLAIDFMEQARNRWGDAGELAVAYPDPNIWNEHPYYVLDVPWSTPAHREVASEFLAFLSSEPTQRRALEHGFRPGNAAVPVNFPESPLLKRAAQGLRVAVPPACEAPRAEVLTDLLDVFKRIEQ
jgi:ABC-type sulfate transport system substrate-binding protein